MKSQDPCGSYAVLVLVSDFSFTAPEATMKVDEDLVVLGWSSVT